MIWVVFAVMTGAAALAFLWPLAGKPRGDSRLAIETNLYQAELADIERDLARGLMTPADAEAARTEAARRLLASTSGEAAPAGRGGVKVAALLGILVIPALTLGLYSRLGAPDYEDMPLQARLDAQPKDMDMAAALARVEAHLAQQPDDARGWEVLAQVYGRMERPQEAARAYRNLIRLQGASPDLLMAMGQSLVFANRGRVDDEAEAAFEKVRAADPARLEPRFYLALAAEQKGETKQALEGFGALLAEIPAESPFAGLVREHIARLGGEAPPPALAPAPSASPQGSALAAMAPAERDAAIRGMVEGLATRLATNGGTLEEWSRLVRAYTVLKEPEKARAALGEARKALGADGAAGLDALAGELGLGG